MSATLDIVNAVAAFRQNDQVPTIRAIANVVGMSHGAVHQRVVDLVAAGVLERDVPLREGGRPGTLRLAERNPGADTVQVLLTFDRRSGQVLSAVPA